MTQVFISYSRRDIRFVEKLAKDVEGKGYDVWFDLTDLEGGDRWAQGIQDGIKESEYFVIVVSTNSIKSEWVEKEFLYASNQGLKIIPILFDDCEADIPIWLLNIQYIDMRVKRYYQKNLMKIIAAFDDEDPPPQLTKESKVDMASLLKKPATLWAGGGVILALGLLIIFSLKPNTLTPEPTKEASATATATEVIPTATETQKPLPTETEPPAQPTFTPEPNITPTATPLLPEITDKSGAEMVLIPAADFFWMGSDNAEADARPAHPMKADNFYIDKFEITNAQYLACVNTAACVKPQKTTYFFDAQKRYADHPVVYIRWQDAFDFCEWRGARLPTEAEWEKAARGTDQRIYPWGSRWNSKYANATGAGDEYLGTAPVTAFDDRLSPYGLYNMAGNVWEWVDGWYDVYPGGDAKASSYFGELRRVARGGSWTDSKNNLLTYKRYDLNPNTNNGQIGFRCAADVSE